MLITAMALLCPLQLVIARLLQLAGVKIDVSESHQYKEEVKYLRAH
jgi:hypothetical protein